ncbi:hypothetical protein CEQ11_003460 [Micrococcus sp. FDAARGOS_333]|nr:hypothetical protein CEQ11_003460 [Micrococcus sp. FDAARGOS_333]
MGGADVRGGRGGTGGAGGGGKRRRRRGGKRRRRRAVAWGRPLGSAEVTARRRGSAGGWLSRVK